MASNEGILSSVPAEVAAAAVAAARPKRVRTGCLTCRERHLKCDEGLPHCLNCKKSNRDCKRGVRLNFIDTQVKTPPITSSTEEWNLSFQDESRDIASEYRGGLGRYKTGAAAVEADMSKISLKEEPASYDYGGIDNSMIDAPVLSHQQLPTASYPNSVPMDPYTTSSPPGMPDPITIQQQRRGSATSDSTFSSNTVGAASSYTTAPDQSTLLPTETRTTLSDPQELLYMQVFVEEVGIWMDSMDPYKHFSRLLPFDSLQEPMLLNAFLACGARHLTLVNPPVYEEKYAVQYYTNSSTLLLRQMQNPYRDTVICATTAVILNVYEIMTERALQRMNHIAGARALIKECGWNANSVGIGAACFWLNVGMELLSCLHFNWQVAWNPDDWGVDMNFDHGGESGREEIWTHRIVWIVAKIANFRASMTVRPGEPPHDHIRLQAKYEDWKRWKDWIDGWDLRIPRTMKPLGHLHPFQTSSKSHFPEVWLIKRTTIVARMFYHTGLCLLAQTNPLSSTDPSILHAMQDLEMHNARELCGIVAHVKDRGVASVALRSLAIAGECLTDRAEQDEVLSIFHKIQKETGWRINFIFAGLKKKWGRNDEDLQARSATLNTSTTSQQPQMTSYTTSPLNSTPLPPPPKMPPMGIVNPQFAKADFKQPDHPYQKYYVPPISAPPPPQQQQPQQHYTPY